MKSPRRMPPKRPVEKVLISATAVLDLTTRSVVADTHHQDPANMWDKRRPSSNALEEDHDIWGPRGRASGVEAGPIGREEATAPVLERMNQQMASSTR